MSISEYWQSAEKGAWDGAHGKLTACSVLRIKFHTCQKYEYTNY